MIDNHAFAETMGTSNRIFVGIRPWRSMSTTVLHLFSRPPTPSAARDREDFAADDSERHLEPSKRDYNGCGSGDSASFGPLCASRRPWRQLQAMTDWILNMGAYAMVRGDQKDVAGNCKWGISVLEVATVESVLRCWEKSSWSCDS